MGIAAKEIEIELLKAKVAALEEKDTNSQKLLESFKVECDYVTVEEPETSPARASSTRGVKISRQRVRMINQYDEHMATQEQIRTYEDNEETTLPEREQEEVRILGPHPSDPGSSPGGGI